MKKSWKSILTGIAAGLMVLSAATFSFAAKVNFTDVSGHWAWKNGTISYMVEKNVLNGYKQSNGTYQFQPDGNVTRAEFVKMLDETFGLTATKDISYSDVKKDDWFYPYFAKAAAQGYLLNYGKWINPDGYLTREEATALLIRYLDLQNGAKASPSEIKDYDKITSHYRDAVLAAVKNGVITGYEDKTFRPQNTLTRAEALTILYRAAGAIYNTSAYAAEENAPSTNAAITKAGITLSKLDLNGRVLVTEGVSGDVVTLTKCTVNDTLIIRGQANLILDQCSVKNLVVDAVGSNVKITLMGSASVSNLTLRTKANITLSASAKIETLTVESNAKNVNITGDGVIEKAWIHASGFVSRTVPDEFEIDEYLTANFASRDYSGSSDQENGFAALPYISADDISYYVNMQPTVSGRVYYYFTNISETPSAKEFDVYYMNATYRGNVLVTGEKVYSEKSYRSSDVSKYTYVVFQLASNERAFSPVVVRNTPTTGSGFSTEPQFDGNSIYFTPAVNGMVYYYYTDSDAAVSTAQFLETYNKAINGSMRVSASRADSLSLQTQTLVKYPYVVLLLQNMDEQYYQPVVVSAGDNGFVTEPEISSVGKIEFKTNSTGILYYYYSKDANAPTPTNFIMNWRGARGAASKNVMQYVADSVSYDSTESTQYPYMVFCLRNAAGNYMTPFVLKIDIDYGFKVAPYAKSASVIEFQTKSAGNVYWYFTNDTTAPNATSFMRSYNAIGSQYKGSTYAYSGNSYYSINLSNSAYTSNYSSVVVMFEDTTGTRYQPVLVAVKRDTDNGFILSPRADSTTKSITFQTSGIGTVYYYFSRSSSAYTETSVEFWNRYSMAEQKSVASASPYASSTISYATIPLETYHGVMLMFSDSNGKDYMPVYVSLVDGGTTPTPDTGAGVTLISASSKEVMLLCNDNGRVYYYESDSAYVPSGSSMPTYYYVTGEKNRVAIIPVTGTKRYVVVCMEGYNTPLLVDLQNGSNPGDKPTETTSGLIVQNPVINGSQYSIEFTALHTGTVTITIVGDFIQEPKTMEVTEGGIYTYTGVFPNILSPDGQTLLKFNVYMQLTSGDTVYQSVCVMRTSALS